MSRHWFINNDKKCCQYYCLTQTSSLYNSLLPNKTRSMIMSLFLNISLTGNATIEWWEQHWRRTYHTYLAWHSISDTRNKKCLLHFFSVNTVCVVVLPGLIWNIVATVTAGVQPAQSHPYWTTWQLKYFQWWKCLPHYTEVWQNLQ